MREAIGERGIRFSYHGISFTQNANSPPLFAFVASSNELAQFCGVARKSEHFLTNYQRALDSRRVEEEVAPFFRIPENSSPTAIVISLHETPLCSISYEDVPELALDKGVVVKQLKLTLKDPDALDRHEIVQLGRQFIDARLLPDDAHEEQDEAPEEENDPEAEDEQELADDEEETSVELGQSMLRELRECLDNEESVSDEIVDTLKEMLLPALVIDGQHRLFGAAKVEEDIPLLVCSLVNPDWKEQVFQFTVINDKARGIPKPFITSLAGMSLTGQELDDLQTRLAQAGVQLWEVEVMQRLGYDPRSAFNGMIEFKVSGAGQKGLGYQTMKRVGRAWYEAKSPALIRLSRLIYVGDSKKKVSQKRLKADWQKSFLWFDFFCNFWDKVKKKFEPVGLWEVHSNLLTAVVIEQFQKVFLTHFNSVAELLFDGVEGDTMEERLYDANAKFEKFVEQYVSKFDRGHFEKEWKEKSLNHKDGKAKLEDYFDKIYKGQSVKNHPLVAERNS